MVDDLATQDGKGRHQGFIARGAGSKPGGDIGRHEGEGGIGQHLGQEAQPVVEFVVAKRGRVIAERIEGGDHRMRPPAARGGGVVCQRSALQEIAIVEQKAIPRLAPGLGNLQGNCAQPQISIRTIRAIVVGHQAGMKVAGGDQAERGARTTGCRGLWRVGRRHGAVVGGIHPGQRLGNRCDGNLIHRTPTGVAGQDRHSHVMRE